MVCNFCNCQGFQGYWGKSSVQKDEVDLRIEAHILGYRMALSLTPSEITHYQQSGYVIPSYRLESDVLTKTQDALDTLIRNNPGVRPEKLVSAHIEGDNKEGVIGSSAFLDLAMHKPIVDLVEQLIGPDIMLWGCHVFCKPAHEGFETPWHQDGHYWPIRPLATCTVWVALEPSTLENGCLRVIPGSHADKHLHPHLHEDRTDLTLNQRMADGTFNEADAADLELQPGQMSMHDVYMIHGAKANTSGQRRTGVALRYMPASSLFDRRLKPMDGQTGVPVSFATRPLWLLRGRDVSGQNDFVTGHARP